MITTATKTTTTTTANSKPASVTQQPQQVEPSALFSLSRAPLTKKHVLQCLHSYSRLGISFLTAADPVSFLLNRLPLNPPRSRLIINRWKRSWPILRELILELEYMQHPDRVEPVDPNEQDPLLTWIDQYTAAPPLPSPFLSSLC